MIKWRYKKQNEYQSKYWKLFSQYRVERDLDVMKYLEFWKEAPVACQKRLERLEND